MPVVKVPSIGDIEFPDSMSSEEIVRAIEFDILPKQPKVRQNKSAMADIGTDIKRGV